MNDVEEIAYDHVVRVTPRAVVLRVDDRDIAFPKSCIDHVPQVTCPKRAGCIEVDTWLLEKEGLV